MDDVILTMLAVALILTALILWPGCAALDTNPASPTVIINKNQYVGVFIACPEEMQECTYDLTGLDLSQLKAEYKTSSDVEALAEVKEEISDLVDSTLTPTVKVK